MGSPNRLPKRVRPGDLDALRRKLWRGILTAEALLESESADVRLRSIHALSQSAAAYRAIYDSEILEGRIRALEARIK